MTIQKPAGVSPKAYLTLHLAAGVTIAALGFWAFAGLIDGVLENAAFVHWDISAAAWVHARTTPLGLRLLDIVTQLGSPTAMIVLGAVGAFVIWRRHQHILLIAWIAAFAGGALVDFIVKESVRRARPAFGNAYLHGHTYSFPSGHSMGSLIGYGMLVYMSVLAWPAGSRATAHRHCGRHPVRRRRGREPHLSGCALSQRRDRRLRRRRGLAGGVHQRRGDRAVRVARSGVARWRRLRAVRTASMTRCERMLRIERMLRMYSFYGAGPPAARPTQ